METKRAETSDGFFKTPQCNNISHAGIDYAHKVENLWRSGSSLTLYEGIDHCVLYEQEKCRGPEDSKGRVTDNPIPHSGTERYNAHCGNWGDAQKGNDKTNGRCHTTYRVSEKPVIKFNHDAFTRLTKKPITTDTQREWSANLNEFKNDTPILGEISAHKKSNGKEKCALKWKWLTKNRWQAKFVCSGAAGDNMTLEKRGNQYVLKSTTGGFGLQRTTNDNALFNKSSGGDSFEITNDNKIKSGNCYLEMGEFGLRKNDIKRNERVARWNCDTSDSNRGHQFSFAETKAFDYERHENMWCGHWIDKERLCRTDGWGCRRKTENDCTEDCGDDDVFNPKITPGTYGYTLQKADTVEECKRVCSTKKDCQAFSFLRGPDIESRVLGGQQSLEAQKCYTYEGKPYDKYKGKCTAENATKPTWKDSIYPKGGSDLYIKQIVPGANCSSNQWLNNGDCTNHTVCSDAQVESRAPSNMRDRMCCVKSWTPTYTRHENRWCGHYKYGKRHGYTSKGIKDLEACKNICTTNTTCQAFNFRPGNRCDTYEGKWDDRYEGRAPRGTPRDQRMVIYTPKAGPLCT